ncbi:hypothetical protein S7711_05653 [Stachybotrys chartarum IBT 7711]|uniref:Golgi apparatus membrane protein TVP15 n=1 Tax=Stachybotrys chartarum (strain CBS 109288 / IBT 7711) TaxID=1280523 RepID=A0A084B1G0_STACB|nr:hypothetical protein S7711_05653 [Stachybotrys chartarum IBT 7711]KFA51738.1 hypothetical protein S40293_02718 [Stachybotrys chartarum IBT 40293]KFA72761.1 hypothetical protein S40288_06104 [Stachybotrys chartarum IBT 40288]
MELSDIFRIVNLVVAAVTVLGGIAHFFSPGLYVAPARGCRNRDRIYLILFGLAIALLEFQIPPQIPRYASFLFSFIGRGIFYIFIGTLVLGTWIVSYIAGAAVGIIGVGYVALEFVPSIEPPSNMREADAGWGAEQV